ncbi:MAG: hypothetical protein EZS28_020342 [Streblomastix strix]|uniref:Uncharacterized protein n=1 Tax=Streblomastix strix TaxID=222440 RepID=A0A5J4VNH9_9EUKA|nr:MAG: hypothetical protein EZS28_020342 [Streblomastix strix]
MDWVIQNPEFMISFKQPGFSVPYVQDVVELENLGDLCQIRPISGLTIFQQTKEIYYIYSGYFKDGTIRDNYVRNHQLIAMLRTVLLQL